MAKKKRAKKTRKNNYFWKILAYVVVIMIIFSIFRLYFNIQENKNARFIHFNDFGIEIPINFPIHGIDVSVHQGKINWAKVKAMQSQNIRISFVFIKATEGLQNVDKNYRTNWNGAKQVGLSVGAYHFFIPGKNGLFQASNFIRTVQLQAGDLPPVVDVEQLYGTSASKMIAELKDYLRAVEDHYHVKPIIYTYASFYNQYLLNKFDNYPIWVAHYYQELRPNVERHWDFWQHSENGHVYGISQMVDFNVYYGDSTAFNQLLVP